MFEISYATVNDIELLCGNAGEPLSRDECISKINGKKCYILRYDGKSIGVMRYNLFWDFIPFLTLISIDEAYQDKGFGTKAMAHFENDMRSLGHTFVMLSTGADESAQHFYRKLGYLDMGAIAMDTTP